MDTTQTGGNVFDLRRRESCTNAGAGPSCCIQGLPPHSTYHSPSLFSHFLAIPCRTLSRCIRSAGLRVKNEGRGRGLPTVPHTFLKAFSIDGKTSVKRRLFTKKANLLRRNFSLFLCPSHLLHTFRFSPALLHKYPPAGEHRQHAAQAPGPEVCHGADFGAVFGATNRDAGPRPCQV